MNIKEISKHVFLSPLYAFILAVLGFVVYGIAVGFFGLFHFVFLSGWWNFFISVGVIWFCAICMYLTEQYYNQF